MSLSRREFLQILGLAVAGPTTGHITLGLDGLLPTTHLETVRGRVLKPKATTYGDKIWADTLVDIHGATSSHYQTTVGDLPITGVQPITPFAAAQQPTPLPFDGQVIGPVGVVRAYCDPTAPLVTRIGHGGVMRVTDKMHYSRTGDWYQVCDAQGDTLGWTQATHWAPVRDIAVGTLHVMINRARHTLTFPDGTITRVNLPADLPCGQTSVHRVVIGGEQVASGDVVYHGVPHMLRFAGGPLLHGAYWHNDFGHSASRIEVNTLAASVLWYADKIHVRVI
jgi:hypothetical protein